LIRPLPELWRRIDRDPTSGMFPSAKGTCQDPTFFFLTKKRLGGRTLRTRTQTMPWDPLSPWPNERRWIWLSIVGWVLLFRGPSPGQCPLLELGRFRVASDLLGVGLTDIYPAWGPLRRSHRVRLGACIMGASGHRSPRPPIDPHSLGVGIYGRGWGSMAASVTPCMHRKASRRMARFRPTEV
jgi:hypothetical protein